MPTGLIKTVSIVAAAIECYNEIDKVLPIPSSVKQGQTIQSVLYCHTIPQFTQILRKAGHNGPKSIRHYIIIMIHKM
jgi:hypothetical protein